MLYKIKYKDNDTKQNYYTNIEANNENIVKDRFIEIFDNCEILDIQNK